MNSTSKSFGATLGSAAAASIDFIGTITTGTGNALSDFADGVSKGYHARRAKGSASREVPSAPKRAVVRRSVLRAA